MTEILCTHVLSHICTCTYYLHPIAHQHMEITPEEGKRKVLGALYQV